MINLHVFVKSKAQYWDADNQKWVKDAPKDALVHTVETVEGLRVCLESQAKPTGALPPSVPQSVTMAQARIALQMAGKLDLVQKGLEGLEEPGRSVALQAWEYAPYVSRNGALVQTLSGSFGMSGKDLDDLFIAAGNVNL